MDPTVEELAIAQRATDPRLEQVQDPPPAPADPEPVIEPPTDPVDDPAPADPEPVVEPPVKPKKTAEEVLKGRVGHLTKTLSTKDQEIAAATARAEAAEALLAAGNTTTPPPPVTIGAYTQAEFDAAVAARAEVQEFNRKADEMYSSGAAKFDDWKDAVDTLVVSGFMTKDLLDDAMAVDDGTAVLHYLGTNLDEAERLTALPARQRVAAMVKLSDSLSKPTVVPISSAPAPIKPVTGSPTPTVDLKRIADGDDMASWAAARAKQGSRWAQGRR